ncbi:carbohydrate porin [Cyanobium sp. Maggiore-St4-Cus]|uniref:iron uptake porin n=1 Tax=Cyanobium sp. Maggiore-St4-Cus TaxID=2823717 RepID=UPI0020CEC2DA|nr:iron uptake porin [Cyanobium sp. Maggiore-St4-Cus]MCP9788505.1 carbohydrate porin [Cyanobium sp. Maggiore-St4-Cus]
MNLSKKLLLALAGASISAPLAASAQEVASLNGSAAINDYMQQQDVDRFRAWESKNQVTSVNQFSDVQPTDWAYQALSNLVEKYGCVAGYPNGKFKGGNAMTRYEAAALLNACLDRISEVTDELQKLLNEFDSELTVLTSRVDGLESKVGQLQAQQFSTTTKLRGEVSFVIAGAPNFNSNAGATAAVRNSGTRLTGTGANQRIESCTPGDRNCIGGIAATRGSKPNATTFNYDARLAFDTSFSGKDLLRTRLRSGNFSSLPFGSGSQVFKLDKAEQSQGTGTSSNVWIDRLFYTFPVGDEIKLTAGALVRNTEILTFIPSAYKADILDFFNLAGVSGTYNKATGAGFGFNWKQKVAKGKPFLVFDANYVAQSSFDNSTIGAFDSDSGINFLTQFGVRGPNYGAAIAYRYGSANSALRDANLANSVVVSGKSLNGVSIAGFWEPLDSGWVPSISAGYGYYDGGTGIASATSTTTITTQSWMVGLQWKDVFLKGNNAGFAFGQAPFSTDTNVASSQSMMYEFFYKYQVSDNISVTPAIFWVNDYQRNAGSYTWGGVIQTTFRF